MKIQDCFEYVFDHDSEPAICGAPAVTKCSFCLLPICANHAHVVDSDRVACSCCLAGLGGVE